MNKLKEKFAKFMYGRYGSDKLNLFMVIVLLVCAVINLFVRTGYFSVLLTSWEFLLLILIYLRMFSRNISKRYAENQKYLELENKVKRFFGRQKYIQEQRKNFHIYNLSSMQTEDPDSQRKRKDQYPLSEVRRRVCKEKLRSGSRLYSKGPD